MSHSPLPILIDCDPGADDMFGLIWSMIMHRQGLINIVGITTSGGNVPAQATYDNALCAAAMMQIDTLIAKGDDKAGASNAAHIHGNDGIGGLSHLLPPVSYPDKETHSHDLLIQQLDAHRGQLVILCMGPLTNLAAVEQKKPGILTQAKSIITMGGAFWTPGNVSPVAEFNYRYDPESAKTVYASGANIVCLPLDLTTQQVFSTSDLLPVLDHVNNTEYKDFLYKLCEFTIGTNMGFRETHYQRGFFVHDANTIGYLMYPHLYAGTQHLVQIETQGEYTRGMSLADTRNFPRPHTNALVITHLDKQRFLEAMTEDFKHFDFEK